MLVSFLGPRGEGRRGAAPDQCRSRIQIAPAPKSVPRTNPKTRPRHVEVLRTRAGTPPLGADAPPLGSGTGGDFTSLSMMLPSSARDSTTVWLGPTAAASSADLSDRRVARRSCS